VQYTPGTKSGEYRPTPPDFTPAFNAHWGSVTPFVLKSSAQFRPAEPPAVNSSGALADIEEVKAIGGSKSVTRTAATAPLCEPIARGPAYPHTEVGRTFRPNVVD